MRNIALLLTGAILLAGCSTAPPQSASTDDRARNDGAADLAGGGQAELYLGIVDGLIRQQRYEAAIAFLAKYQKTGALTPRFRVLAGKALAGAGRYEEAITSFRNALKSDLQSSALNGIGEAEASRGNWRAAANDFRQASLDDPANADYLNNLGFALLKQQPCDPGSAANALERAYELAPRSRRIRNNLVLATARAGQTEKFKALLNTEPDSRRREKMAKLAAAWTSQASNAYPAKGNMP